MHIVIMGCGRVGSALANELDSLGHSVAVIDSEAKAFKRLRPGFGGSTVTGIGFDRDVLIEAESNEPTHSPLSAVVTTPTSWPPE